MCPAFWSQTVGRSALPPYQFTTSCSQPPPHLRRVFAELRSYVEPPELILQVVKALLHLLCPDKDCETWTECKQVRANMQFGPLGQYGNIGASDLWRVVAIIIIIDFRVLCLCEPLLLKSRALSMRLVHLNTISRSHGQVFFAWGYELSYVCIANGEIQNYLGTKQEHHSLVTVLSFN